MGPGKNFEIGPLKLRINWLILACVLLTALTFVRLGLWQLGRAEEKMAAEAEFSQQQEINATPIDNIPAISPDDSNDELRNLHVSLEGEYVNERTILLLAKFFEGQIGFEVVTPFRLQDSNHLVLVSRGWTSGILPPNTPPRLRPISGPVRLSAQIYVPEAGERILASQIDAGQWPLRIRSIEIEILESILQEPLFPYVVRLTQEQPGMLVRHWPVTNTDVNANLSYAFQWFTFALIVLLGSLLGSSNLISMMRDPESEKFR